LTHCVLLQNDDLHKILDELLKDCWGPHKRCLGPHAAIRIVVENHWSTCRISVQKHGLVYVHWKRSLVSILASVRVLLN